MAAAQPLPAPGTEYGPCARGCSHRDCESTRAMANTLCRTCGEPIGYSSWWYQESTDEGRLMEHQMCALARMHNGN